MPNQSEHINELITALYKAQMIIEPTPRNREVEVRRRDGGGSYKFSYTTLDALIEHVREPLTENGLWFTQTTDTGVKDGSFVLVTTLYHSSGQWISGEITIPDPGKAQELGSALTYHRRYALAAILGLAPDQDDDGATADGHEVSSVKDKVIAAKPAPTKAISGEADGSAALKAAIKFAQDSCSSLKTIKTEKELMAWRVPENTAKIGKLATYDKELEDMVMKELRAAEARVIGK